VPGLKAPEASGNVAVYGGLASSLRLDDRSLLMRSVNFSLFTAGDVKCQAPAYKSFVPVRISRKPGRVCAWGGKRSYVKVSFAFSRHVSAHCPKRKMSVISPGLP